MDRRKSERHDVGGTVWFHWKDALDSRREHTGSLRNVSAEGLYVESLNAPPLGTEVAVQFEFLMPGKISTVSIAARGLVNRVEASGLEGLQPGFAIATGRMKIRKSVPSSLLGHLQ